jgi:hypothetical protein
LTWILFTLGFPIILSRYLWLCRIKAINMPWDESYCNLCGINLAYLACYVVAKCLRVNKESIEEFVRHDT